MGIGYNRTSEGTPSPEEITNIKNSNRAALPIILGIAAIVFVLDQLAKLLVVENIPLFEHWSLSPAVARIFKLTFTFNTGAAFGLFPQLGTLFMVIAVVAVVGLVLFYHHLPVDDGWIRISLGLLLGGAMGNLLDRIVRGYVVDFVDIGFWPIFNIADVAVVVGVCMVVYYFWQEEQQQTQNLSTST